MLTVPSERKELIRFTLDLIEKCRVSVGSRTLYYQLMNSITETGRYDGGKALINMMFKHVDRTAATLYSPVELKFSLDFDRVYPKNAYERAAVVAKQVTRQWDRSNADILFGQGVFEALKYGWCGLKQWSQVEGKQHRPAYYYKLVMPWQMGVYNEAENDIERQIALCETTSLTLPEVWRRIYHLPNAEKLFNRIKTHSSTRHAASEPQSYFHQLLSTSQIQTGVDGGGVSTPGGIVQMANDPNSSIMGPQLGVPTVEFHELWVQDDEDYTTIQMVEPDIIVAPFSKKANLLGVEGLQPYTSIQPNHVTNWFWGRSELVDLIEPQGLLSQWCDDAKRLLGLQVDKILAFIGEWGLNDEVYAQFRNAGFVQGQQGSQVQDLTPKVPAELLPMIQFMIEQINTLSGFPEILQGKGESGVRAGAHADTLVKTSSPPLRDRALMVERQCAQAADRSLTIREAKDASRYWTNAESLETIEKSSFLLTDLPEDWRVTVDSHSASPIFANESAQLITYAHKSGVVDGEYVIDNMALPNKDEARIRLKEKQKQQQELMKTLMKQNPEIGDKILQKQLLGSKR